MSVICNIQAERGDCLEGEPYSEKRFSETIANFCLCPDWERFVGTFVAAFVIPHNIIMGDTTGSGIVLN